MENKQPFVVCVMLVNGRHEMAERALRAFDAQTYKRRRLVVWDTGTPTLFGELGPSEAYLDSVIYYPRVDRSYFKGASIGALRNAANKYALAHYTESDNYADVICHWDSDDYSHPQRLAEQVALLQASGKRAVGYNEVVFWDSRPGQFCGAWLYSNPNVEYFVGASMMYWREAWQACKFEEGRDSNGRSLPEDARWWAANHKECMGVNGFGIDRDLGVSRGVFPRLICEIHGDNTSTSYREAVRQAPSWKRAPAWDGHCKEKMEVR